MPRTQVEKRNNRKLAHINVNINVCGIDRTWIVKRDGIRMFDLSCKSLGLKNGTNEPRNG